MLAKQMFGWSGALVIYFVANNTAGIVGIVLFHSNQPEFHLQQRINTDEHVNFCL